MKVINRVFKVCVCGILCVMSAYSNSTQLLISEKNTPEVTFDKVQEIFGFNLNTQDTTLKSLLLAVGFDHTAVNSPNVKQDIGIPYIVKKGPGYWIDKLKNGDYEVDVLVNNALLLLFTKEEIPGGGDTALSLMKIASTKGYWPADFYIADINLKKYLMSPPENEGKSLKIQSDRVKVIAEDTLDRFSRCAEIGFAPCQYRIGFWLSNSKGTIVDGIAVLRKAIDTTLNDKRYEGSLNAAMVKAAEIIVFNGEQVGMNTDIRTQYVELIQNKLARYSEDIQQMEKD